MSCQSRFDARYWMLGAGALGRPRGMVRGGRREEGSGRGARVYLWRIHVDIWQNQYNIVKLKNKIKLKKKSREMVVSCLSLWLQAPFMSVPFSKSFRFLKKYIYFNWRIITLQYCDAFPCNIFKLFQVTDIITSKNWGLNGVNSFWDGLHWMTSLFPMTASLKVVFHYLFTSPSVTRFFMLANTTLV